MVAADHFGLCAVPTLFEGVASPRRFDAVKTHGSDIQYRMDTAETTTTAAGAAPPTRDPVSARGTAVFGNV